MKQLSGLFLRREFVFLALAILLCAGAAVAYWASRATVLTVAVAPRDGTEPALIQAYADALAKRHKEIRLRSCPSTTCATAPRRCGRAAPTSRWCGPTSICPITA